MPAKKEDKKLLKKANYEEEKFLKQMRGKKILPCDEPLYKTVARNGNVKHKQDGGFVNMLVPLITALGPPLVEFALKRWTGGGISYVKQVGDRYEKLSDSENKHILYNILTEHPYLFNEIFK